MDQVHIIYILIATLIVLLYTEWIRPSVSFLLVGVALIAFDILETKELLQGFANEQLAVIIMLLIISHMISQSGMMALLFNKLNSKKDLSQRGFLARMMSIVGLSSSVFNNTPLVALFMPYVHEWSNKNKISPSKLLIPLSYASILGGCITLVGTSTNLIVNGIAVDYGLPTLGIFDFSIVGGVMLIVGILYLLLFSNRLLPDHRDQFNSEDEYGREYFMETHIKEGSSLIGKSVEDGGLRNLKGVYLVEIIREEKAISPVSPKEELQEEDVLIFAGDIAAIPELKNQNLGLSLPKACDFDHKKRDEITELVVAHNSSMVNKTVKESDFRGRYDGGILAVHRNGERLTGKIGDIEIKPGDLLLVLEGNDFRSRIKNNPGFYVLRQPEIENEMPIWKPLLILFGLFMCIILNFFDVSLFKSLAILMGLGVVLNISSPNQIRNSVDFNLFLVIAIGLGLGRAMMKTGASEDIVDLMGLDAANDHPLYILLVLFIITNILASFITSKAAVAIMLPLAFDLIVSSDINHIPIILTIAFGGAANFLTPIGYQTNLMVYGPGRYSFNDFFKIGLPLTLIYGAVSCVLLALIYDLM